MPRKRITNKHLPQKVYQKHGAFYYVDPNNKWHKLGVTFAESMANWAKLVNQNNKIITMNDLFSRYLREVAPLKSAASYKKNIYQMQNLTKVFGQMIPSEVTPVDIYGFLDIRGKTAPITANREKSLLSHVFSYAIRWGVCSSNPCRFVKRNTEKPRDRYVENWEFDAVWEIAPPVIQCLMTFAVISAQRIGDILKIKLSDITDEGIFIQQGKTGKKLLLEWSDELRNCVDKIKKLPRSNIYSFTLFCNSKGQPLVYEAFSTLWLKVMKRALADGIIKERFTFHDLRGKSASDLQNRAHASALLGHSDQRTTQRIYIRTPEKVRPSK